MSPEPSGQVRITLETPGAPEERQYSLSLAGRGEWSVQRTDGMVGGIFVNLSAALRFLHADLETLPLPSQAKRAA
jgi:hypothetical protein